MEMPKAHRFMGVFLFVVGASMVHTGQTEQSLMLGALMCIYATYRFFNNY